MLTKEARATAPPLANTTHTYTHTHTPQTLSGNQLLSVSFSAMTREPTNRYLRQVSNMKDTNKSRESEKASEKGAGKTFRVIINIVKEIRENVTCMRQC